MIIKNIEPVDHLYQAKVRVYDFMRAMTAVIVQADYGLLQLFVTAVIITIPFIAIEFKNNDFFPATPSNIFRMCLLSNMPAQFGISEDIISAVVILIEMLVILGSASHLLFESFFDPLTKFVTFLVKIVQLMAVPVLDFALQKFTRVFADESTIGQKAFGGLIMLLTTVTLLISTLYCLFEVRLVRKKTTLWNLENSTSFASVSFFLFQACLISTQVVTILLAVLMSLSFCVYMLNLPSGMIGEYENLIITSLFRYRVVTDITIIVSILTKNPNFAFGLWLAGMLMMIAYHALAVYRRKQRILFLPVCDSPPEDFYDFYYCCKEEFKGDEGSSRQNLTVQHSYIYHLHRFHCARATCRLNEWLQVSNEKELQSVISAIIEAKKDKCLHNKIVHELWNLELGRRCRVSVLFDKTMTISEDFVLYCIDKMTKDSEVTIQSSQSNKNAITKVFYDLIFETSTHYSLFYEELSRAIPVIDSLVRHGTEIHQKIAKLKEVYAELLKLRLINFKMIELYIEFVSKFVSEGALDKGDISRLSKLQQNIYFEDISENYLPTLTFYPESGSIENANGEAQKFLRTTRFELKCSGVNNISQPELSLDQLHVLSGREESNAREEPLHLFFRRGDGEFGIGSVVVDERLLKGKKVLVMQITEDLFSSQKNAFLVDEEFALKLSLRQHIKIKAGSYRAKPLLLDWEELFSKYVAANREKIERSKMVKIVTDIRECTLVVKRLTCAVPGHHILETQMMLLNEMDVKGRYKQNSVISFRKKSENSPQKQKFEFHYSENEDSDKSVVLGLRGDSENIIEKLRHKTLTAFQKGLTAEVVDRVIKDDTEFDRGIKTYRLWEGELYNVDLEDREAYNDSFEGKMADEHRVEIQNNSSFECYVSVGVVLLGLALVGISAFVIVQFQNSTSTINILSKQHTNIDSLMIDFNRILGLLRDLASGFSAEFPSISASAEIEDSYRRIQALKTKPLFDNVEHSMEFQGLKMTGTLIELVDVMFAHMNQILSNGNFVMVESIHTTCVDLVNEMEESQDLIFERIGTEFQGLTFRKNIALFCSLAIIFVLFILLIYFCYRSSGKLKNNLSPLLFLSDGDAHTYQENASKIKYAVEMIRKNFQVDTQSLLISGTDGKRRKHPKKVALSTQILATVVFLAVAALAIHLGCLFFFSSQFQSSLQRFLQMKTSGDALIKSYSAPAELANLIGHNGELQADEIDQIKMEFDYIMFHMSSFEFSPALNSFIHTLYFQNSCPLLMPLYNMTEEQCSNTTPEFTIKNPFQIGLAYYFNRQNYYFYNNVTEVFAHTSIHSRPFAEIMTNLTTRFNNEGLDNVDAIEGTVNLMSYIIITIDVCYILAFFGVQFYFRRQISSIRVIVEFFREKLVSSRAEPKVEEEFDQSQRESESDEELLPEARKEGRDRRRERTTIQNDLSLAVHLD